MRHEERFNVEPGSLPDMTCGVNGKNFVQEFRPTHVTAKWTDGVLVEARIWGPRVLEDGSLGERELDHRWKKTATGPVRYSDLPRSVAGQLLSYSRANGFTPPPEQL